MLSIAVYTDLKDDANRLKSIIQDFLIEMKIMAKVSFFDDGETMIMTPSRYDAYIIDMDMDVKVDIIDLVNQIKQIDTGSHYIYMGSDPDHARKALKARCHYFISKPFDPEEVIEILKEVRKKIKEDSIIIKTAAGERRVRVNHLNYINIVKRCLCYHLTDSTMFDGQTLRSSFEKAIHPLEENKAFLFLPPSLLINLGEIKDLNKDNIIFDNGDVLFFPMKQYDNVRNAWHNFNKID